MAEGITGTEQSQFQIKNSEVKFKDYSNFSYSINVKGNYLFIKSNISIIKSSLKYPAKIKDKVAIEILNKNKRKVVEIDLKSQKIIKKAVKILKNKSIGYFQTVDAVLNWVYLNFKYNDNKVSLLEGNCVEAANLTVNLLTLLNIPARSVNGIIMNKDKKILSGSALHSFVEIYYPDLGWMFSDPLEFFHYVPANYIYLGDIDINSLFAMEIEKKKYLKNLQFVDILDNSSTVKSRVNLFKYPAN